MESVNTQQQEGLPENAGDVPIPKDAPQAVLSPEAEAHSPSCSSPPTLSVSEAAADAPPTSPAPLAVAEANAPVPAPSTLGLAPPRSPRGHVRTPSVDFDAAAPARSRGHSLGSSNAGEPDVAQQALSRHAHRQEVLQLASASRKRQKELYSTIQARFERNLEQINGVIEFVTQRSQASRAFAKALGDLPRVTMVAGEGASAQGSLDKSLETLMQCNAAERQAQEQLSGFLLSKTVTSLNNTRNTLQTGLTRMREQESKLSTHMEGLLEQTQKRLEALAAATNNASAKPNPEHDPWLMQLAFWHDWQAVQAALDAYNDFLVEAVETLQQCDRHRVEALKPALAEALTTAYRLTVTDFGRELAATNASFLEAGTVNEFDDFAKASLFGSPRGPDAKLTDILPRDYATRPVCDEACLKEDFTTAVQTQMHKTLVPQVRHTVSHEPLPLDTLRVGVLEMKSLTKWKQYVFVVSRFGYLHWFAPEKLLEPSGSLSIRYLTVKPSSKASKFSLAYNPPGVFNLAKKMSLRLPNGDSAAAWTTLLSDLQRSAPPLSKSGSGTSVLAGSSGGTGTAAGSSSSSSTAHHG